MAETWSFDNKKVFIAGHRGLVGSAIVRAIQANHPSTKIITATRQDLDLRDQSAVKEFITREHPDLIIDAAAKVGGILANNTQRFEFLVDNLRIQNNLIEAAHQADVDRFIFLGSSCIYPRLAPQPMAEESLLTGPLEYTNRPYALAKIAGIEAINALNEQYGRRWISLMPTNLYGPGDNFDPTGSHVIPGMMRRFHAAKTTGAASVDVWGTGKALREFLYIDDMAAAVLHLAQRVDKDFFETVAKTDERFYMINLGSGQEVAIADLAQTMAEVVGFQGQLQFDGSKPDGTPRKLMADRWLKHYGWRPQVNLKSGLNTTYHWFQTNIT